MTPIETRVYPHDPLFVKIETLLNLGDEKGAMALWNETLNEQFESGIAYMKENIGEGHVEN
jgi:hypothetical protein